MGAVLMTFEMTDGESTAMKMAVQTELVSLVHKVSGALQPFCKGCVGNLRFLLYLQYLSSSSLVGISVILLR